MKTDYQVNGYTLHVIPSDKFKDITISVYFKKDLSKKNKTLRSILGFVMAAATSHYPSQKQLAGYLEELYGANLSVNVMTKGQSDIICFKTVAVNQEYLPDHSPMLLSQINLIKDVIFNPFVKNNSFDHTLTELKKNEIKARIQASLDDKVTYSANQLFSLMGHGTPLEISSTGYLEDIESITEKDLYEAYIDMIHNDEKHVYIAGHIKEEDIALFNTLSFPQSKPQLLSCYHFKSTHKDFVEIIEKQNIIQSKLNLGYQTDTYFLDDDNEAMTVFSDLLGGYSQSRLFLNIREKNSLCYYINSIYDPYHGVMSISSGIEMENYQKVKELINYEINELRKGHFSKEELEMTKMMIISSLAKAYDSIPYLISLAFNRDIIRKKQSIEDYIEVINKVKKEDIQRCAEKIRLDTVYFLTKKEFHG